MQSIDMHYYKLPFQLKESIYDAKCMFHWLESFFYFDKIFYF